MEVTVSFPESSLAAAYIEGDLDHTSGSQSSITRIVIHATVSPTQPGGARGNANYFQSGSAGGLAHYVVDPGEIIQCAPEGTICWHAPPNENSIGIELCDPQGGDPARWSDPDHQSMLALAAGLVRDIAARWNVPLVFVDSAGLLAGLNGITGHAQVAQAWHQTDHTDPGVDFLWPSFMSLVQNGATSARPPAIASEEDQIMAVLDDIKAAINDSKWSYPLTAYQEGSGIIMRAPGVAWIVPNPAYLDLLVFLRITGGSVVPVGDRANISSFLDTMWNSILDQSTNGAELTAALDKLVATVTAAEAAEIVAAGKAK